MYIKAFKWNEGDMASAESTPGVVVDGQSSVGVQPVANLIT